MPEMKAGHRWIEYKAIRDIVPAEANPKKHADDDIRKSIGTFGFTEPVLHDGRTGRLVAGHGRLEALLRMERDGGLPPDGVEVKAGRWHVPVVYGWSSRSDADAEAYLVASNRLTIKGGWDNAELYEMLDRISTVDIELVHASGYDDDELQALMEQVQGQLDRQADEYGDGDGGEGAGDQSGSLSEGYQVIVFCDSEQHQEQLLEQFTADGLRVRALMT